MKLTDYAKLKGVTYKTAWNWFNRGLIPNSEKLPNGTIIIDIVNPKTKSKEDRVVIYCRVNDKAEQDLLDSKVAKLEMFCAARGYVIDSIFKEVGSGSSDKRKQLWAAIDCKPTHLVVEYVDQLADTGYEYLSRLLSDMGTEVIALNRSE